MMTKNDKVRRIGAELEAELDAHGWSEKAREMERKLWAANARFTERGEVAR